MVRSIKKKLLDLKGLAQQYGYDDPFVQVCAPNKVKK